MKSLLSLALVATGLSAFAQDAAKDPATIVITPQHTLSKNDTAFRKAIAKWSDETLKSTDYKNIKAQPSAEVFPGAVKAGFQFVNKTVSIEHKKMADSLVSIVSTLGYSGYDNATMYSTGLYAKAGEYVEIDVPKNANVNDLEVQIGAHSDRLNYWVAGKEDWRRMPIITKKQQLVIGKNRLASPFGGLIYINVKPKAESRKIDFKISHAVAAPLFVLGKSTQSDWENQLKNNKAPWGEMATENVILTLPDSVLQTIKNPEEVLKLWDLVVLGELDLANMPAPF